MHTRFIATACPALLSTTLPYKVAPATCEMAESYRGRWVREYTPRALNERRVLGHASFLGSCCSNI